MRDLYQIPDMRNCPHGVLWPPNEADGTGGDFEVSGA